MYSIALSMLWGDRIKCLGLVFGVTFSTLLITQQISIFTGLMSRVSSLITSIPQADVWVMDPRSQYIEAIHPLREVALRKVRSVPGVLWALPLHKSTVSATTEDQQLHQVQVIGIDGVNIANMHPTQHTENPLGYIRQPLCGVLDISGYHRIWPGDAKLALPKTLTIHHHRIRLQAVCDAPPAFFSFPLLYVSYNTVKSMLSSKSAFLSFVLVKAQPGIAPEILASRIHKATGLQSLTQAAFAQTSIDYVLKRTGIPINFAITIILGALVGGAITAQTFYLFFMEHLKQFAAMKVMGVSNRMLLRMALIQSAWVGSIGYSLGTGLTSLFFWSQRNSAAFKGFTLHWQVLVIGFCIVFFMICISLTLSLRKLFKVDPAIVFRS